MATWRRAGCQQRPGLRGREGRARVAGEQQQAAVAAAAEGEEEEEAEEEERRAASPRSPPASAGGRMVALLCSARLGLRRLAHDHAPAVGSRACVCGLLVGGGCGGVMVRWVGR